MCVGQSEQNMCIKVGQTLIPVSKQIFSGPAHDVLGTEWWVVRRRECISKCTIYTVISHQIWIKMRKFIHEKVSSCVVQHSTTMKL